MSSTGPLKLARVGAPPGLFLVLRDLDRNGKAIAAETPIDVLQQVNAVTFIDASTKNFTFSAFQLVSLARGTWQLQFIMTRGPGLVNDDLPLAEEMPFVLGQVADDPLCSAGLVPQFKHCNYNEPTPGSVLFLQRGSSPHSIILENATGKLCLLEGRYCFVDNSSGGVRGAEFFAERLVDLYNVGITRRIHFAENPWSLYKEVVPVDEPVNIETELAEPSCEFVANPWKPMHQREVDLHTPSPPPQNIQRKLEPVTEIPTEPAANDTWGAIVMGAGVALISACSAFAFGRSRRS